MFLGSLFSSVVLFAALFHDSVAIGQYSLSAPSVDLFEDKPKKTTTQVQKPITKKTPSADKKEQINSLTKPSPKPTSRMIVPESSSKLETPVPPQEAPRSGKPKPVLVAPVRGPLVPTGKVRVETAKRAASRTRNEFEKRISLGYASWREPMTYAVGIQNRGGKASFAGFLLRYEMSKKSSPVNWGGSAAFFYGAGDAKSSDSSTYRVNKVGAQALIASPFAYFEPMPEVQVKIALDVVYKILSWPSTVGAYDVKTKPLTYGPNVGVEYRIWNQWLVEQRIGSYSPEGDIYWSVGATYKLP